MATERKKKEIVITCPKCGYEYLPAEVYYPKTFFGNPANIDRTPEGKIDVYDGQSMSLIEDFTCEHCGNTFRVTADVKFKSQEKESIQFESVYTTELYPSKITLSEDDCN